ncbi:IPT/TIG domain-containing protein [bacterium]|nr:IPT/TIG domain-containing protein [bacterium]
MKGFLALLLLAAPNLQEILPNKAKPGGIVFLNGSGFGDQQQELQVRFGTAPGRVISAQENKISVQVPWDAPKNCDVTVEQQSQISNKLPFECLPAVRISVDKNPIEPGETTQGHFTVYHSDKPVLIFLNNASPQVVRYPQGDQQMLRTSGGPDNSAHFTIQGVAGNRIYDVDYRWGTRSQEEVEWKLPWHQVQWNQKGGTK